MLNLLKQKIPHSPFRAVEGFLIVFFISQSFLLKAEILLPAFFSGGMVLQQQTEAPLWGKITQDKKLIITTSWNNKKYKTEADENGNWKVKIQTPDAGGPFSITIKNGKNETVLKDVLIGEVWLCSGQSNMEMPMKGFNNQPVENSAMDILKSKNPQIRLFTVKRNSTLIPHDNVQGSWASASPVSVKEFSATAYYFGRLLQEILQVPIGLIATSWGGSSVEAWMEKEMLRSFSEVKIPQTEADIKEKNRTPTTLYNAMIAPLTGYSIKGLIWYQGETNYDRYWSYADMLSSMVNGWRAKWNQGNFPFYYCQIAPYEYKLVTSPGKEVINSAYLREAQLKAESKIGNAGMVVLMDVGTEKGIHPPRKQPVGERLALQALAKTYKIDGITAESPIYKEMTIKGDTIILSFDRTDMWISAPKGELKNFKIAGADKIFYPAQAWIDRSKVLVRSGSVKQPVAVRYAFENYAEGDLFGTEGLPVSSFRTDNW